MGVPLPKSGRIITPLEDVLNHMTPGQVISVKQVLTTTGQNTSKHYRDKLAALLPWEMSVAVKNADGDLIGTMARVQSVRPDNQYGDIKCLSKKGVKGVNP